MKKKIQDGDIILCHDTKNRTPETARQMVRYLEEQLEKRRQSRKRVALAGVSMSLTMPTPFSSCTYPS